MAKEILRFTLIFIVLVLCQVVVFNHICIFGVAVPLAFIYFILKLPVTLGINWVMTLSFILGLTIDIFSNTQGVNALACTLLSVMRTPVLKLYVSRIDDLPNPEPSIRTLGLNVFMKYAITLTTCYCALFFLIEAFAFFDILRLVLKIICSSLLTFIIIMALDGFTSARR